MKHLCLGLWVVVGALMIAPEAPAVIKIPETAITEHDYRRGLLSYNRRTMVEPYQTIGRRDPKWDESAIAFLDAVALRFSDAGARRMYRLENVPSLEDTMALGKRAIDAGCDDPMVIYCYAALLEDNNRADEAEPLLLQTAHSLLHSQYPVHRTGAVANRLYHRYQRSDPAQAEQQWEMFRDTMLATLLLPEFSELDRRMLYARFKDMLGKYPPDNVRDFVESLDGLEGADPWLKHTLSGYCNVELAWAARGSGFAHTVTDQGWVGFFEYLARAKTDLEAAWQIRQDYPEPAHQMIKVANGAGARLGASTRTWFDRAVSAQMDYRPAYRAYVWSIYPRWGGSHRQMYSFARECQRTGRYDTQVPWMYVEIVLDIARDGGPEVWSFPQLYQHALRCMEDYEAENPHALGDYERSLIAAMAWVAKDYERVKEFGAELGSRLFWTGFNLFGISGDMAVSHAHAMSTEHALRVEEAEDLASQGMYDEAAAILEQLAPLLGEEHPGQFYLRNRRAELTLLKPYLAGEWTRFQPPPNRDGWYVMGMRDNRSKIDPNVAAFRVERESSTIYMLCRTRRFGSRYEITGQVNFDKYQQGGGGPVVAYLDDRTAYRIYLRPDLQRVELRVGSGVLATAPANVQAKNSFRVQVWDNHIVVFCNDEKVLYHQTRGLLRDVPRQVGIAVGRAKGGTEVYFRNLRIRALTDPPEGIELDLHERGPMREPPDTGLL